MCPRERHKEREIIWFILIHQSASEFRGVLSGEVAVQLAEFRDRHCEPLLRDKVHLGRPVWHLLVRVCESLGSDTVLSFSVCRPTPIVKWIMEGGSFAFDLSRIAVADYGMTLRFLSVQFGDQGSYKCQGSSDSTQIPVRIVFQLTVQCTRCQSYSKSICALLFSSV